jgi:hypothetical protein
MHRSHVRHNLQPSTVLIVTYSRFYPLHICIARLSWSALIHTCIYVRYMEKRHTVRIFCLMLGWILTRTTTKSDEMRWKLRWRHARSNTQLCCILETNRVYQYSTSFYLDVPFQHIC